MNRTASHHGVTVGCGAHLLQLTGVIVMVSCPEDRLILRVWTIRESDFICEVELVEADRRSVSALPEDRGVGMVRRARRVRPSNTSEIHAQARNQIAFI